MAQQLLAAPVCASWCLLAPPLPMQSLEKQEAPGRHHPAADSVPILKEPSGRYLSGEETCVGTSSMPVFVLHRSMTSLKSWAAAFLAEEALFCALLTQQCLIPPPKLHSALVHTHPAGPALLYPCCLCCGSLRNSLYPDSLGLCPWQKKPISGFSELILIALTQNCHFMGSSVTLKLVCSFFSPSLIRIKQFIF